MNTQTAVKEYTFPAQQTSNVREIHRPFAGIYIVPDPQPADKPVTQPIAVMSRYEMKYILSAEQACFFRCRLSEHMRPDKYGLTTIASLYYDTPDFRLIRASLERPPFKEKLRLRSYGLATDDSPVYLELKRKADGIVYKRRVATTVPGAAAFFAGQAPAGVDGQISRELVYFRDFYRDLSPACLILYDRTAYEDPQGQVRVTVDERPRYRMDDLDLRVSLDGRLLLPEGTSILEIKVQGAMPLWLSAILAEGAICKTSFSKYGAAYKQTKLMK